MKAAAFDLGDTLIEYEGLPPSWVEHYPEAIGRLAARLGVRPAPAQIEAACAALRLHNTRLHPRETEVRFARILRDLAPRLGAALPSDDDEEDLARVFFQPFRARLRCFPDTRPALEALRARGLRIGVFTDVPYGMPRSLVIEDVRDAGLEGLFDVLVTSVETGFRKPAPQTLARLAADLGCAAADMAYVGNEEKDMAAARAFGCPGVLLDRAGRAPRWGQERTIAALAEF